MLNKVRLSRSLAAVLVVLGSASFIPSQASADDELVVVQAEPADVRTEIVSYSSLNLASLKGQKALKSFTTMRNAVFNHFVKLGKRFFVVIFDK